MKWRSFDKPEHQRGFGRLPGNDHRHPTWGNTFNPYSRNAPSHCLDKRHFDALLDWDNGKCHSPDHLFMGCLDAPQEIPLGATACISTVGGFYREEYLNLGREWESWNSYIRASNGPAEMLKGILAGLEKSECES